tara:strand:+ start:1217 stop:1786 length:570 start_codon:yes stop_codon:yes gene_type:complete
MRIISGTKKGHTILSYKNKDIRPLTDKNRETIFNLLIHGKEIIRTGFDINNSVILDLFAGTGSFSFEALSRGASKATAVESSNVMIDLIYKNAEKLKFRDKIIIFEENACSFSINESDPKFDLVYCDPPYEKKLGIRSLKNLIKKKMLNHNAIIVMEEELKSKPINLPDIEILRIKEIGISKFSFLRLL